MTEEVKHSTRRIREEKKKLEQDVEDRIRKFEEMTDLRIKSFNIHREHLSMYRGSSSVLLYVSVELDI